MAFDGSEGGEISLSEGAAMTQNYRQANPRSRKAHFFGKDILNEILAQNGCKGIRCYYGINSSGEKELILVGADGSENDLTNLVVDLSSPCPNLCDQDSPLNK